MSGSGVGDDGGAVTAWDRARAGDGEAFGEVYDACHRRVYRHALRLLGSPHDAEDALAATFLELWRRRDDVRVVDGSVLPWLLVTATNTARNLARSRRRYRALLARLPAPVHSPDVADHLLDERLDGTSPGLLAALSTLNATDRGLIALVALEGWPIGEAAVVVGITPGAARTRLGRARARLRAQLPEPTPPVTTTLVHAEETP